MERSFSVPTFALCSVDTVFGIATTLEGPPENVQNY